MTRRAWRRAGALLAMLLGAYLVLLAHPQQLFAFRQQHHGLVAYSDAPLPPETEALLARVEARLRTSPLFDAAAEYRVFFCQAGWRFALLANRDWRVGGVLPVVGRNVFLRPSAIARDRLVSASGIEVPEPRTLTYFVTHELTHTLTVDFLGRLAYARLPVWVREGYADHVAKASFDVAAARADQAAGAARMDPARSGLYDAYQLRVEDALAGRSVAELLNAPPR